MSADTIDIDKLRADLRAGLPDIRFGAEAFPAQMEVRHLRALLDHIDRVTDPRQIVGGGYVQLSDYDAMQARAEAAEARVADARADMEKSAAAFKDLAIKAAATEAELALAKEQSLLNYNDATGLAGRLEAAEKERDENEGVIRVWRRRTEAAEGDRSRLWTLIDGHDPDNPDDGPRCRDCADNDGTCEHSGLPCDPQKAAEAKVKRLHAELARLRAPVEGEVGEVVKRLGRIEEDPHWQGRGALANPDGPEAADLIQRLAARVAEGERVVAEEREACAKLMEQGMTVAVEGYGGGIVTNMQWDNHLAAKAIRARAYLQKDHTNADQ